MAIVSAEKFVQAARDNGYAVGGFNTNNLEFSVFLPQLHFRLDFLNLLIEQKVDFLK